MTDATIGRAGEPGPDVFVSFNSDDRVFAGQLTDGLHRRGLDAWFDEDQIEPGEIWRNEVVPGLLRAGAAVIIVSDDGLGPVQAEEILLLLDRRTREPDFRLVPVVLGDVDQRRDEPLVAQLLVMSIVNVSGSIDDGVVDTIANRVLGVHDVDLPSTLGECPYPGLSSFQADVHDAARFHGREKELDEIRAHLGTSQVVCVLGPSGVGKSSLALAGLEKLRRENRFGEAADVEIAAIEPGSYPMDAVRRQLAPGELTIDLDDPGADELRRRLHLAGVRPTLILVVDQLEAIFAPSADPEQRDRFIDTLVHAMRNPLDGRYLVLTMRSDMLDRAYDHPGLGSAIADFEFTLGPMSRDGLQKAVQQPAWDAGARFAPGVAATIVDEIADQPNALPLMALGLQKMWPHASGDTLTIESYRRGGGVRKALDQLGDSTIEPFEQADEPLVRWLLLRLVELNDGQRATSRICPESELEPSDPSKHDLARRTVRALLNERILVSGNTAKGATVSFVHDAVVSSWGTLREWIDEAKRLDPRLEELREAAAEWDSSDRPRDLLLSRRRLRILGEDELTTRSILGQVDRDFLDASRGRQRLFTAAAAGLALVMMVAIGGGAFGLLRADSERQAREVGDTLRLATDALREQRSRPDLGLLLAVEANSRAGENAARSSLAAGLGLDPQPIRFWSTGTPVAMASVIAAPDGTDQALVSDGGSTIRLCSLFTESCRAWLPAGPAQVVGLDGSGPQHLGAAVLASGRLLAGSLDDTPREIEGVSDGRVVALHPEQPLLAVGHRSGSVTVGSPSGPFETIGRFPSEVVSVGFDPGTRWVAATDGRTVSLLPIGSFNGFDSLWEGNVSTVSFSADGSWLLVGDENTGDLLAFDLAGGGSIDSGQVDTRPRRLAGHRSAPTVIAVGPDAVVTGSLDGDVRMWSLGRFVQVGPSFVAEPAGQGVTLVDRFRTTAVGLSPDRLRLFVFRQDGVVVTWDTGGRSALARRSSPLPGPAVDVAGFGGGDVVALLADGTVVRHDGEGVEISRTASRVMDPLGITTDGDGSSYAVFGAEVEVFTDVGDSQLVDGLGPGPHWAAFVPGESELVVGTGTGALHVVELPAGTTRRVITADDLDTQGRSFTSIAPSPEGRRLAVALRGNDDTAIRIVDLEDGSVSRAEGHTAEVDAVVWGPSGDVVYSGSDDRTIIEWSVPDLSPRRLDNHTDRVTGLAVVEPADVLLSSSQDGTVRLWDLASTDRAPTAIGLGGPLRWRGSVVDTLAAAGPGRAVSLESNTLVWWTVDIDGWVELACSIAGRSLTEAEEISYLADGVATTSCEGAAADVALLQR